MTVDDSIPEVVVIVVVVAVSMIGGLIVIEKTSDEVAYVESVAVIVS